MNWSFRRQFWGLVLILLGVLAFVQMSGFHLGLSFWPVVWMLAGLSVLYSGLRRTSWFTIGLGLWLGSIGLFDTLHDAGLIGFSGHVIASAFWPLILVAVGVGLLFGRHRLHWAFSPGTLSHREGRGDGHLVGDLRYGNSSWTLDGDLDLDHGVGDVKVDLTTADITPGVHTVKIGAWIGEILVRVPDNVSVSVDAASNIGEVDVLGDRRDGLSVHLTKQTVVSESPVELRIEARLGIGSLRVTQRPPIVRFTL